MTGKHINPTLSVLCAAIYIIGGLWPIVTIWIKPKPEEKALPWWLVPTITWSVIGGSVFWFIGFIAFAMRRKYKRNEIFVVEKKPEFESAEGPDDSDGNTGGYVLVHETVYLSWIAEEIHGSKGSGTTGFQERPGAMSAAPVNRYAGTDFEAFYQEEHVVAPTKAYNSGYRP
jgi:hypothetical protein